MARFEPFRASALLCVLLTTAACAGTSRPAPVQAGSASLYLPGRSEPQLVRFTIEQGEAVMGGDIRLGPVESLQQRYGAPSARGDLSGVHGIVTIDGESRLWPGGVIPYEIDGAVADKLRGEIMAALTELDQRTNLTLRPRTPADRDYIVFNAQNTGGTCDSLLGKGGGGQPVRVNGCGRAAVMHEILHAAGFDHEHQRADRDAYVTILWDNVEPSHREWLERIDEQRTTHSPYDHRSIMHYQSTAFSRNGRPTIVSKVGGVEVRGVEALSPIDIQAINRVYAVQGSDPIASLPAIFGGLGIPLPGGAGSKLPFPGSVSLPALPQWGSLPEAAGALRLPWAQ